MVDLIYFRELKFNVLNRIFADLMENLNVIWLAQTYIQRKFKIDIFWSTIDFVKLFKFYSDRKQMWSIGFSNFLIVVFPPLIIQFRKIAACHLKPLSLRLAQKSRGRIAISKN